MNGKGFRRRKEKGAESLCNEIVVENSPNLEKEVGAIIQGEQSSN